MTTKPPPSSQLTPLARGEYDEATGEHRVIAVSTIPAGHWVATLGGILLRYRDLLEISGGSTVDPGLARISLQVDEDRFLVSTQVMPADWINHGCEPNTGLLGPFSLVSLRSIEPGEEICFDYATSDGSSYDEFECRCGSTRCRGKVRGEDWQRPELWQRYEGHFSPYLARRIQAQSGADASSTGEKEPGHDYREAGRARSPADSPRLASCRSRMRSAR